MKHILRAVILILILSVSATGCVRITVTMPDSSARQEAKDDLTAAGDSVREAVESIPGKIESLGEDISFLHYQQIS